MKESRKEYRDVVAKRRTMVFSRGAELRRVARAVIGRSPDSTSWGVMSASEVVEGLRSPFPIKHAIRTVE
jgi:hypothetical protein